MRLAGYNCWCLGNGLAVRGILALQKKVDPDILFLSETKLDEARMEKFRWKLGLPHMIIKDCDGISGGLALFWRRGINVSLRWKGRMHIDVDVERAWLPPYVVLVINDNLYGLMGVLSYICRFAPYALLDLHLLESRLREEEYMLLKASEVV